MGDLLSLCNYRKRLEATTGHTLVIEDRSPFMIVRHLRNGVVHREERILSESMLRDLLDAQATWLEE